MSDLKSGEEIQVFQNRKYCPGSTALPGLYWLSFYKFLVVCFTFRSMRLFWVSFCEGCKVWVYVLSFSCMWMSCWTSCWKTVLSFAIIAFAHLSNIIDHICLCLFLGFLFFHWSMCLIAGTAIFSGVWTIRFSRQRQSCRSLTLRWLDSHKEGWNSFYSLLHYLLSLGPRWYQGHLKCLFRLVWSWMVLKDK